MIAVKRKPPVVLPEAHITYKCIENGKPINACESRITRGMCFCTRVKFFRGVRVNR